MTAQSYEAALQRAQDAWGALRSRCIRQRRGTELIVVEGDGAPAHLWPTSQVLAAAIARATALAASPASKPMVVNPIGDADSLDTGLGRYQVADVYADSVRRFLSRGALYFDDNAWIALNLVSIGLLQQIRLLPGSPYDTVARADKIVEFLRSGEQRGSKYGGGVEWKLGGSTLNTCSTAPSGLVALRLVELTQALEEGDPDVDYSADPDRRGDAVDFASRCADFVDGLRNRNGLIADHVRSDGSIAPQVYSYNQGTSIGLYRVLARVTDSSEYADAALELAQTSVAYYSGADRLWKESPAFVAIYLRHLRVLRAETGSTLGAELEAAWIDRLASDALDPKTGFYTGGGIGSYDGSIALDQAGITAALYLRTYPKSLVPTLC